MYTIKITSDNPEMREEDLENGIQVDGYALLAFKNGKPYLENVCAMSVENISRFFNQKSECGSLLRQAVAISEGYRKACRIEEEDRASRKMSQFSQFPSAIGDLLAAINKNNNH